MFKLSLYVLWYILPLYERILVTFHTFFYKDIKRANTFHIVCSQDNKNKHEENNFQVSAIKPYYWQ